MKLHTVNVLLSVDEITEIESFTDDDDGNKEAEQLFTKKLKELNKDISDEEVEWCIEDGNWWKDDDSISLLIIHST